MKLLHAFNTRNCTDLCILAMVCLVVLASCGQSEQAEKNEVKEQDSDQSTEIFKVPVVVTESVHKSEEIEIPGLVAALPDHSVKISPAISGKIVSISGVPGSRVGKGDTVATLDDTHLQDLLSQSRTAVDTATVALKQAKNNLEFANENVQRQKRLFDAEVSAKKDIVAAESQVINAQSQIDTAQTQLRSAQTVVKQNQTELAFTKVHSPIAGIVANRFLNVGDSVDPNTAIMQVIDLDEVIVNAQIAVESAHSIKVGNIATVMANANTDDGNNNVISSKFPASVLSISPTVDAQTNTVRVQLKCANEKQILKDGEQVLVTIKNHTAHDVILLPKSALVPDPNDPKKQMVYIVENQKAHRIAIQGREIDHDKVEVFTGLKSGQKVIAKDAYGLPDKATIEELKYNQ